MDDFYRGLIPTALWLGMAAFVVALFLVVFSIRFPLRVLTLGGIVRGTQTLLLIAVASYCAHRIPRRA